MPTAWSRLSISVPLDRNRVADVRDAAGNRGVTRAPSAFSGISPTSSPAFTRSPTFTPRDRRRPRVLVQRDANRLGRERRAVFGCDVHVLQQVELDRQARHRDLAVRVQGRLRRTISRGPSYFNPSCRNLALKAALMRRGESRIGQAKSSHNAALAAHARLQRPHRRVHAAAEGPHDPVRLETVADVVPWAEVPCSSGTGCRPPRPVSAFRASTAWPCGAGSGRAAARSARRRSWSPPSRASPRGRRRNAPSWAPQQVNRVRHDGAAAGGHARVGRSPDRHGQDTRPGRPRPSRSLPVESPARPEAPD